MIRDPFYRQIIDRLGGPLDPELFEQCAADLLRAVHPTLVPMRGGRDAGMDGAIADGQGEPFPLVSTTRPDVIGNFTDSLNSYLQEGGARRRVVLATPQHLTPRRKRNLSQRAKKLGFALVQIHDQAAIADLLYRDPRWCLELLNLPSDPPALSAVPRSSRPSLCRTLIGREADLTWLGETRGDRLIVGQPGAGKTFLLQKLVSEGDALFVVGRHLGEIAAGIRSEHPRTLIVDDAHMHSELLSDLRHMRDEIGADYAIVASCWPGDSDTIARLLALPAARIRTLELLTRDQIVLVIKETGIAGPDHLIRELVDQAAGRPGLAVTLAHLCLQKDVRKVVLGDVLSAETSTFFAPLVGTRANEVLAAFAVGGDSGMSVNAVAQGLGLTLLEVRTAVTRLAAGGVIRDRSDERLSVWPATLRHALVRDVFFAGATSLPIKPFIQNAPRLGDVACTLIGAEAVRARVPQRLLIPILENAHFVDAWSDFAWLGREQAQWVIQHHPEQIALIAGPTLYHVPEMAIPVLLNAAIGDQRQLRTTPDHPLRLLESWIANGSPLSREAVTRRETLLNAVESWLKSGHHTEVGIRVLQFVLSPEFENFAGDPGSGRTVTMSYGLLSLEDLKLIGALWPRVRQILGQFRPMDWTPLRHAIESWAYAPRGRSVRKSPEMLTSMKSVAREMLSEIIPLIHDRPGLRHWAHELASIRNMDIEVPLDLDFEMLYPEHDFEHWAAARERQMVAVRELAVQWSGSDPANMARRIALIEQEAMAADLRGPRWTPLLCEEIARRVTSRAPWIEAMINADLTAHLVHPFLREAALAGEPGWEQLVTIGLSRPKLRRASIAVVLTLSNVSGPLLETVLSQLQGAAETIQDLCLRNEVPESVVSRLLRYDDAGIASAAAKGEWYAEPMQTVRESLREDWEVAFINHVADDLMLSEVFERYPPLAYRWLQVQVLREPLGGGLWLSHGFQKTVTNAIRALSYDMRTTLLQQLPVSDYVGELVASIVGDDLDLYAVLLNNQQLRQFHLAPLYGRPEGPWLGKARLALDAGYSAEDVFSAIYSPPFFAYSSWGGNESDMWARRIEPFERLLLHEDIRIQRIGRLGIAYAEEKRDQALQEERNEAIYGRR